MRTGERIPLATGIVFVCVVAISSLAQAKELKPTSFRAVYSMELDTEEIASVKACAVAGEVIIEDARTEPSVGQRSHEKTPALKQSIAMTGVAADWVRAGFAEIARHATLRTGTAGKPSVKIAIANIWVTETVYRNAEYDGRVVLDVSVHSPAGDSCWSDRLDGFAENYGRAGKEVNYQETVNHALDRALSKTFSTMGFVDALCSCGASTQ